MKRRKFLQALGLCTFAPAIVGTCSWKKVQPDGTIAKKFYSKPEVTKLGIDFGNNPDSSVLSEWNVDDPEPSWLNYEFTPGNEIVLKHYYVFPNKPIFPNYMTTDA